MRGIALAFLLTSLGFGQTFTGGITGFVQDSTGGYVPGASVAIRNIDTGATRNAQTDAQGRYSFVYVQPGTYEVSASAEGFKRFSRSDVVVMVEQTVRVDAALEVGAISESVNVTSEAQLVQTESGAKGQAITGTEIMNLPLVDRNWTELALLTPGVVPNDEDNTNYSSVNGARGFDLNFVLDGGTNKNMRFGVPQTSPTVDSIQEFKMQTSGYSAEYGRMSSGILNAALRSGTNQFHGSAYEFLRNDALDARNFFDQEKSKNIRHNFGATLGGPVIKDRLFFFANYEGLRSRTGNPQLSRVASEAQRRGDFSESRTALLDPVSRAPFPGNIIPASRIHPVSTKVLEFVPRPNLPGASGEFNYFNNSVQQNRTDKILAKADLTLRGGDAMSFRVLRDYTSNYLPFRSTALPGFEASNQVPRYNAGINFTHMFRPNMINQTMLTFSRGDSQISPVNLGRNYPQELGLTGLASEPNLLAFPRITIRTLTNIGDMPQTRIQWVGNDYQVSNSTTLIVSSHNIRWGVEIVRSQLFELTANDAMGTFAFQGRWTNEPMGDFLLGLLNNSSRRLNPMISYVFNTTGGFFVQDDWKVNPDLTLNLGVRYDYFQPLYEKYNRWSNFAPELGRAVQAGEAGFPRSLVYADRNNFAPRVGLAWRPFGSTKTAIRAGYGIFYGASVNGPFNTFLGANYPFTVRQQFNRSNDPAALTFSNPFPDALARLAGVDSANGYEMRYKVPDLQQYNFTIERELRRGMTIETSYVGSKGTHLGRRWDLNQPVRVDGAAVRDYPALGMISYQSFDGDSSYNSLQVLLKNQRGGFVYRVGYTFSKSIDTGSSVDNMDIQDSRNRALERGRSDFDRRHALVGSIVYELPKMNGSPRIVQWIAGDWRLASLGRILSGVPFTPGLVTNTALGEGTRPDRIGSGELENPTVERWFDPAAFIVPENFRFGNSGRNILTAPGRVVWDVSLMKHFALPAEGHKIQVRWEVMNVPNHANFGVPQARINDTQPGRITSAAPGRQMQLALRYQF